MKVYNMILKFSIYLEISGLKFESHRLPNVQCIGILFNKKVTIRKNKKILTAQMDM